MEFNYTEDVKKDVRRFIERNGTIIWKTGRTAE